MGISFDISPEQVESFAAELDDITGQLHKINQKLNTELTRGNACWQCDSAAAFFTNLRAGISGNDSAPKLTADVRERISGALSNYRANEASAREILQSQIMDAFMS